MISNKKKSLKAKINELETKLLNVKSSQTSIHNVANEKIFSELIDRKSRACNIILFNVPEFSTLPPVDKYKDTSSFLADLLKPLD